VTSTIWAPWRMAYIGGPKPCTGCILCALPCEQDDRAHLILYRGQTAYVMMNRYPYNNGHLLVVPYRHAADLTAFSGEESLELLRVTGRVTALLREAFGAEGFNVGFNIGRAAGAGIADHVHLHVVPRWVGDTNFMPVLADTRVMPEYLNATYDKLLPCFRGEADERTPCSSR